MTRNGAYWDVVLDDFGVAYRSPSVLSTTPYPRTVDNPIHVYERPAEQYRYGLHQQEPPEVAVERAVQRVTKLATDDLKLTERAYVNEVLKGTKSKRYRRVIHPELSETGTCGLCLAASTRVYTVGDLLPLHNNCRCTVMPIVGKFDPGKDFNEQDLAQLYKEAGGNTAKALGRVKYKIDTHGELGPYILPEAKELVNKTKPSVATNQKKVLAQIASLEKTIPELREKVKTDSSFQTPLDWQLNRLKQLKKEASGG